MWDKKQSVREIKRNSSRLRGCFLIKWKDSGHGQASKHITITITITETVFRVSLKAFRTLVKIYASLQFVKFAAKLTNPLNYCLLWSKNCATLKWSKQKTKKAYTLIKLNQPKTYSEQGVQTPHDILWKQTNKQNLKHPLETLQLSFSSMWVHPGRCFCTMSEAVVYLLQLCLSSAVKNTYKLAELSEISVHVISFYVYCLVVSVSSLHIALMYRSAGPLVENRPHHPA